MRIRSRRTILVATLTASVCAAAGVVAAIAIGTTTSSRAATATATDGDTRTGTTTDPTTDAASISAPESSYPASTDGATPSSTPATGTTTASGATPASRTGLVGWATRNGGTTGGGNGATVTVTDAAALDAALTSSSPLNIRVSGMISTSGMHKVASNKTVTGVGAHSGLTGGGLNISKVHNVIVRNLIFRDADDDSINVQYSTNVWIDHNDLANGFDGLVDIKHASDFVTVSWNHVHGHNKTMLLGHSDNNGGEDRGHLRVTYHHNWFDGTTQRHPRVRFANPVHVYNNYYNDNSGYGVASTCDAGVLVESNYFENVADPYHLGEGSSPKGNLVARGNYFVNSGKVQTGGGVDAIPYHYTLDPAAKVKSIVTASAGVGKIGL